jgi:Xaa-Pro aminopeptidase
MCREVWGVVRDTFARHGFPMAHYAGHQIGTSVNERPRLLPFDDTAIEAGMVFAVEAGAYEGPGGRFGARSEKVALVTESGPEILSAFLWELS